MGWESSDVVRIDLWSIPSRSNNGSLALVSCLSVGYKFASVLRCIGLVNDGVITENIVSVTIFFCDKLSKHATSCQNSAHVV